MATVEEITALLHHLSPASLEQVRQLVQSLREQDAGAAAQPGPQASHWSFDFVDHFSDATFTASRDPTGMECKVADATCDGVTRPALWEHPPVAGSAVVAYLVAIPNGVRRVQLKFSIGIRDGAELPADQFVAFRILVNGWKLWSTVKNSHSWEEHAIEMPQLGSDVVRVEFVTDGLGHHRWDWAVWGLPRLEEKSEG